MNNQLTEDEYHQLHKRIRGAQARNARALGRLTSSRYGIPVPPTHDTITDLLANCAELVEVAEYIAHREV